MHTHGGIGVSVLALVAVVAVLFGAAASAANALSIDELRQRIAERREELRSDRFVEEEEQDNSQESVEEDVDMSDEDAVRSCECSARLSLARPDVRWKNNVLEFIPRFDLSFRVRGEEGAPNWNLALQYDGVTGGVPFSGSQEFSGQCFDGRYRYSGLAGTPVVMPDVVRSLFMHEDAEELVPLELSASLSGCDSDSEHRESVVEIEEFGNLDTNRWRRVR